MKKIGAIRRLLHFLSQGSRPAAGLLSLLIAVNILRAGVYGCDLNVWWLDLRWMGEVMALIVMVFAAGLLAAHALPRAWLGWAGCGGWLGCGGCGQCPGWKVTMAAGMMTLFLSVAALVNAVAYWRMLADGRLYDGPMLPFSLGVSLFMLAMAVGIFHSPYARPSGRWAKGIILLLTPCAIVAASLAQMICFGWCDYRRPADAIVVFGAGVYADGSLSLALEDRMKRAVELYRQKLAGRMILSGGPGMGAVHETEAMRRYAIDHGVPGEAIACDRDGLDTRSTVANTAAMLTGPDGRPARVLAVSQFYHLPRIKLSYQQVGMEVYTVPACQSRILSWLPYYMARETAALWVYYLR